MSATWGSSEYFRNPHQSLLSDHRPGCFVQDALDREYRLGFIGGGDYHDAHPGNVQVRVDKQKRAGISPSLTGGGLAGVYAEELTRDSRSYLAIIQDDSLGGPFLARLFFAGLLFGESLFGRHI